MALSKLLGCIILGIGCQASGQVSSEIVTILPTSTKSAVGELHFRDKAATSHYVGFKSPDSNSANMVWTVPSVDAIGAWTSNGSGIMSVTGFPTLDGIITGLTVNRSGVTRAQILNGGGTAGGIVQTLNAGGTAAVNILNDGGFTTTGTVGTSSARIPKLWVTDIDCSGTGCGGTSDPVIAKSHIVGSALVGFTWHYDPASPHILTLADPGATPFFSVDATATPRIFYFLGHVYPNVDATFDLGENIARWSNLFLSGNAQATSFSIGATTVIDSLRGIATPAITQSGASTVTFMQNAITTTFTVKKSGAGPGGSDATRVQILNGGAGGIVQTLNSDGTIVVNLLNESGVRTNNLYINSGGGIYAPSGTIGATSCVPISIASFSDAHITYESGLIISVGIGPC